MHKTYALIIGGTKGLGAELSLEAWRRNFTPFILGRSAFSPEDATNPIASDSFRIRLDLADEFSVRAVLEVVKMHITDGGYVIWNAGIFLRKPLKDATSDEIDAMFNTHLRGPIRFLQGFHSAQTKPYHLVVIASTSSWRVRTDETLYCALKAAKATFARNFSRELVRDLPGSKVTLINPGGLKTPNFWSASGQDISAFMEPSAVSKIIWDEVLSQKNNYHEIQIMRNDDGSPKVVYGPRLPEMPF